jgi:hypothetical protein
MYHKHISSMGIEIKQLSQFFNIKSSKLTQEINTLFFQVF